MMSSHILKQLLEQLNNEELTSENLVQYYVERIASHDVYYNSIASINPLALEEARYLDGLRKKGQILSPLHGIPILIKDNIDVIHMPNTANSYLLKDHYPKQDAPLIKTLKEAGMIILGKTNLSEWAYFMSDLNMPSGYGSLHGQVKHPYRDDIDPLGSSTGSAVAVALDFAPLSIGTETNGSLMAPAYQCSIVSLKPTFGTIQNEGIIPISPSQDTAGPMGRTVIDVSYLFDVLTHQHLTQSIDKLDKPFKVGILSADILTLDDASKDILTSFEHLMKNHNHMTTMIHLKDYKPLSNSETLYVEMKSSLNDYLSTHDIKFLKTLADVIRLNALFSERTLRYGQTLLERSNQTDGNLNSAHFTKIKTELTQKANIFESLLNEHQLDALVSTYWLPETPISGLPSIVVPAKALEDAHPKSLVFIGKRHDEKTLFQLAHFYETHTQKRKDPILK